jgi:hypothetical protein
VLRTAAGCNYQRDIACGLLEQHLVPSKDVVDLTLVIFPGGADQLGDKAPMRLIDNHATLGDA